MEAAQRIATLLPVAWEARAAAIPGGEVHRVDGLLLALTNLPVPPFNVALVEDEPSEPAHALDAARDMFRSRGLTFGVDLDPGIHGDVRAAAEGLGMTPVVSRTAMSAAPALVPALRPPWEVDLLRGEDRLDEIATVDAAAFGGDEAMARRFVTEEVFSDPRFRAYVAVREGKVVGAAETFHHDGLLGVFGVAVHPSERRRGIGAALTAFAVRDRPGETDLAVLQSSEMALGVYRSLGFETGNTWEVWSTAS